LFLLILTLWAALVYSKEWKGSFRRLLYEQIIEKVFFVKMIIEAEHDSLERG